MDSRVKGETSERAMGVRECLDLTWLAFGQHAC